MAVHCRRGHRVAHKEVKQKTRLGVTDPSGLSRGPNLSLVRLPEGNECGRRSGLVLTFYTLLEARKRAVVSAVLSGVNPKFISFCAETAHATACPARVGSRKTPTARRQTAGDLPSLKLRHGRHARRYNFAADTAAATTVELMHRSLLRPALAGLPSSLKLRRDKTAGQERLMMRRGIVVQTS
jgi:hypothetical protein